MKNSYFVSILACLVLFSVCLIVGCGSNATGGGGGGGGGAPFAANIWVSSAGDDTWEGTYARPLKTIQMATLEVGSNEVIGVMAGTYYGPITWTTMEGVTLRGVSSTDVMISGEGTHYCIRIPESATIPDNQTITIESLTIKDGEVKSNYRGAGIGHWKSTVTLHLKKVIFDRNGWGGPTDHYGGGLGMYNSAIAIVEDCIFSNNTAADGAAIEIGAAGSPQLTVINSEFYGNTTEVSGGGSGYGGALYLCNGTVTLECLDIHNNTALIEGGGVFLGGALAGSKIENCLFYNNKALGAGGGICDDSSSTSLIYNCTIVSNEANTSPGPGGGGVYVNGSTTDMENCIVWGNVDYSNSDLDNLHFFAVPTLNYSDVHKYPSTYAGGVGTVEADPAFRSAPRYTAATDFQLTSNTTTDVTHGGTTGAGIPTIDYAGHPRSGHNSMGAWQY